MYQFSWSQQCLSKRWLPITLDQTHGWCHYWTWSIILHGWLIKNNQIRMSPRDEELTTFCTPKRIYYYKVMYFGLKNIGATYQIAIQKIFDDMLQKNVECYVNDLVLKSKKINNHFQDLQKVSKWLWQY